MSKLLLLRHQTSFDQKLDSIQGLIRWPLQEVSGDVALARNFGVSGLTDSSQYPGPELLTNGDFSAWTGIPPNDTPDNWTVFDVTPNREVTESVAGNQCQFINDASGSSNIKQSVLTVGERVKVTVVIDSISSGSLLVGTPLTINFGTFTTPGTHIVEFVPDSITLQIVGSASCNIILDSVSAQTANPLNGDNNGATVGQPFGGNIPYSYSFDGNNDYIQLPAATLDTVLDGGEFTLGAFVNPSGWAVVDTRGIVRLFIDSNNQIDLRKGTANRVDFSYRAGAVDRIAIVVDASLADQNIFVAMTVSKSTGASGEKRNFINGVQQGVTQTGLGVWSGGSLLAANTVIGALTTTTLFWLNLEAEVFLHPTRAMTPAEIAEIYQWSGI